MCLGCHLLVLGPTWCVMGPGTPCLLGLLLGVPVCLGLWLQRGLKPSEHPSPVAHRHVVAAIQAGCGSWGPTPAPVPIPVLESLSPRHAHIPLQYSLLSTAPSLVQDTPVWPHPPPPWSSSSPALLPLYSPFLAHCSITFCGTLSVKPVPVQHLSKAHKAPCLSGPQQPSSAAATVAASPQGLCTCPSACPRPPFLRPLPFPLFPCSAPNTPSTWFMFPRPYLSNQGHLLPVFSAPDPDFSLSHTSNPSASPGLCPANHVSNQPLLSVPVSQMETGGVSICHASCLLTNQHPSPNPASLWGTWEL